MIEGLRPDLAPTTLIACARHADPSQPLPRRREYAKTEEAALGELLDAIWIEGEGEELGLTVTDAQITTELAQIKKQSFKTRAAYEKFLSQSNFSEADVLARVKLQLLSTKIQDLIQSRGHGQKAVQREFEAFVTAYQNKWRSRTVCGEDFVIKDRCSNGPEAG